MKIAKINTEGLLENAIVSIVAGETHCTVLKSDNIALIGSVQPLNNIQYELLKKCKLAYNESIAAYIISTSNNYTTVIIDQYQEPRTKKVMIPLCFTLQNDSIKVYD